MNSGRTLKGARRNEKAHTPRVAERPTASAEQQLEPMIAAAGRKIFDDAEWLFEPAYSGFRALLFADASGVRFVSERGSILNTRLPELEHARRELKGLPVVLDGVVVAGSGNLASFRELRHRYAKAGITGLTAKEKVAVKFVVLDVLVFKGRSMLREPFSKRRERLDDIIGKTSKVVVAPKAVAGKGTAALADAEKRGFEGVLAKRRDALYEPGKRSKSWLRFKSKTVVDRPAGRHNVFNT